MKVRMSGHDILGGCEGMDYLFPLISVTHSYVNENMIFLVTIPIKPNYDIDQFKLYRVLSLPVNLNKTAIKLVVGGGDPFIAIGSKYLVDIRWSQCLTTPIFNICAPHSHYSDYKVDSNCIATVVRNSSQILSLMHVILFSKNNQMCFLKKGILIITV